VNILYVADRWDPKDHNQASGTDYEIYHALRREGANVKVVGPFNTHFSFIERGLRKIHNHFYETMLFKYPLTYFFISARQVNRAIKNIEHDLVVSMYSAPLVLSQLKKPLLYFCDSTVKWLEKQWQHHAKFTYFSMGLWERHVINKSEHIISFSESNADVLDNEYDVPRERLDFFAIPASIPHEKVPKSIEVEKSLIPVKLLLVGRDRYRKGVDIAQEIVRELNAQGVKANLRIVGLDGEDSQYVSFLGFYNKTIPEDLDAYLDNYRWAHFLVHPARFEAAGIVPSEAAAFGVPTLTNNTGGLATTVKDDVSGLVLPKDSPAEMYVSKILKFINNPDKYQSLARSTKDRYQRELHWEAVGKKIIRIAEKTIELY